MEEAAGSPGQGAFAMPAKTACPIDGARWKTGQSCLESIFERVSDSAVQFQL